MLYIVPTPIGNLEDITIRSVRLFREAHAIICEDGRTTRKLMDLLQIENKPKMINITKSHVFNQFQVNEVLENLKKSEMEEVETKILLVSDAGTPGISDPGWEVIDLAIKKDIKFSVIPGPVAFVPAAISSGLISKDFVFLGFLPLKKGRQTAWKEIQTCDKPIIIYESVHRIKKFLEECNVYLEPERRICICNDLTKFYEKIWRVRVGEIDTLEIPEKGEFCVVIQAKK